MRPRSIVRLLVTVAVALTLATPTLAGGGGLPAVELDEPPPSELFVDQVVNVGFMVTRHGAPVPGEKPFLSALHKETKEDFRADAVNGDTPGHYMVEAKFHEPGTWFWEIVLPRWDTSTTLAPVTVLAEGSASSAAIAPAAVFGPGVTLSATIHKCTCVNLGETAYDLTALGSSAPGGKPVGAKAAAPVKQSVTTIDALLDDILAGAHTITVAMDIGRDAKTALACGEIGGMLADGQLAVGLRGVDGAPYSGIAVLEANGKRTTITTYLTEGMSTIGPTTAGTGNEVAVEIQDAAYNPAKLEIKVGDTVTWTNRDPMEHTVSFDDMTIVDSPLMAQGETFSYTFDTPGTYSYICNPHPFMTAQVVVTT